MRSEKGNFLLQALLALTLVFAFMPFFTRRLAMRDIGAQMFATTEQVNAAKTAAKIYVRENADNFSYNTTIISGDSFSDTLEPYGLPMGFVPQTALGQDISLIINKNEQEVSAVLRLSGGDKLTVMQRAELAHRIGFFAVYDPDVSRDVIDIGIQLADMYSDVVLRNDTNVFASGFLSDLEMNNNSISNVGSVRGDFAAFETASVGTLTIVGNEFGRKEKNTIESMSADKSVFQTRVGDAALSVARGTLNIGGMNARTVSQFGDTGNMTFTNASVDSFDMVSGRTGFYGPKKWDVHGNVVASRISFSVERLDVGSFINVTRGQDVYIDNDTLEYSSASGIDTDYIYVPNITLRDQTSDSLLRGGSGATILDIRPSGTSLLPDVSVEEIDNDAFAILANPYSDSDETVKCNSIISDMGTKYNSHSLAQYIICQYVYWQRLEQRINEKACLQRGEGDCK